MFRKLKLYGELAEFVGHKEFEIKVDSLAKAVSFLVNNFPQVEKFMNPKYYQVKVGNYDISKEEINFLSNRAFRSSRFSSSLLKYKLESSNRDSAPYLFAIELFNSDFAFSRLACFCFNLDFDISTEVCDSFTLKAKGF